MPVLPRRTRYTHARVADVLHRGHVIHETRPTHHYSHTDDEKPLTAQTRPFPPHAQRQHKAAPLLPSPSNDSSTTADQHVTASSETRQISYNSIIFFVCAGKQAPQRSTIGSAVSADLSGGDGSDGDDDSR